MCGVVEKEGIALRVDGQNVRKRLGDVAGDRGFGHGLVGLKIATSGLTPLARPY